MDLLNGQLMTMRSAGLNVLHEDNADEYWSRMKILIWQCNSILGTSLLIVFAVF
jgi:hypothetical protein